MTSETPWDKPLRYAASLAGEENLVLLYSGTSVGKRSFLAWGLREKITNLDELKAAEAVGEQWFGWLGYGLRGQMEDLSESPLGEIKLDDLLFARFENVVEFDHERNAMRVLSRNSAQHT